MKKVLFPILALILVFGLALPMATPALADTGAEIWTDKEDYAPGEMVTIFGSGFNTSADVNVTIERPDGIVDAVDALTDDSGSFTCTYQLDGIEGTYTVTVTDGTNTATTRFTDSPKVVSVSVTPTSQSVVQGTDAGYTVTVTRGVGNDSFTATLSIINASPSMAAASITFSPQPITFPAFNPGISLTSTLTITTGSLSPDTYTFNVKATRTVDVNDYATSSTVTLTAAEPEGGPEEAEADLSISKSGPDYAHVGDEITYTYEVENAGPDSATNVEVTDDKAGAAIYVSGDNGDGKLDVGETWTFEASYTVLEEDSDPLENTATVSSDTSDLDEENNEDSWSVDILHPAIAIEKSADMTVAYAGDTITYTYTVTNPSEDTPLQNVSVDDDVAGTATSVDEDSNGYNDGDTNEDGWLDFGETWTFTATYIVQVGDPDPLVNTATASGEDILELEVTDEASAEVDLIARICGYKFHDKDADGVWDAGELARQGVKIELWLNGGKVAETLTGSDGSYCFDELNAGTYTVKEVLEKYWQSTTPNSLDVTLQSGEISEDNNFGNARLVTRTQGFWSTHQTFTGSTWNDMGNSGYKTIGSKVINSDQAKLFGGFWSNIATKTTGVKRTLLDQARMQLAQQLLAAMLNVQRFGDDDLGTGAGLIAAGKAAFAGTDRAAILSISQQLDAFNKSGDTEPLPLGVTPGPADPKGAQKIANKVFWDSLP